MKRLFTEEDLHKAFMLGKEQGLAQANNLNNSARTDEFTSQVTPENSVETDSLIKLR
ncbi:MAG: hypothetical protein ACRCW0_09305 [Clostridium sp.]